MTQTKTILTLSRCPNPTRLDHALSLELPDISRRQIVKLIQKRKVWVNDRRVWIASWKVKNGDRVRIDQLPIPTPQTPAVPQEWIIAEKPELLVVNKPAGLVSHATRHTPELDLTSQVRQRYGENAALYHRLDRDTSGLVLFSRSSELNAALDQAFKAGTVRKHYLAIVEAEDAADLEASGVFDEPIDRHPKRRDRMHTHPDGRKSETRYRFLAEADGLALLQLMPITGRTHQLRVHLAAHGAPILGDKLYGRKSTPAPRLMLHAAKLELPMLGVFPPQLFRAPCPLDFLEALPTDLQNAARAADPLNIDK